MRIEGGETRQLDASGEQRQVRHSVQECGRRRRPPQALEAEHRARHARRGRVQKAAQKPLALGRESHRFARRRDAQRPNGRHSVCLVLHGAAAIA